MAAGLATPAAAEPALWVARDDDSTVYLFGTIHVLRPGLRWMSADLMRRLAEADTLYLEVDLRNTAIGVVATLGTSPDLPLSKRLSEDDLAYVKLGAQKAGVDFAVLDPLQPWLAAVTLSALAAKEGGYRQEGADLELMRKAIVAGKEVRGLETVRDQLEIFANAPEAEQIEMLVSTVDHLDGIDGNIEDLATAWIEGDEDRLMRLLLVSMAGVDTAMRDRLLTDRNRAWADEIADLMAEGAGTTFVAVGAAHLSGEGSVQQFLAERGITVERVAVAAPGTPASEGE
jgi:Uncharacterized protein conserved in bacteria